MAGTAALVIDRLACEYQVPPAHPSPDPLRWRLDHIVRTRLAAACASALEPALDPDDPSVWLVDRMECELATDVGEDDDAIARELGGGLAAAIATAIAGGTGGDGGTVLRFEDQAAYVAQFVCDLADGWAWGRWYYAGFDGLRPLATGRAIVTALVERAPDPLDALLRVQRLGRLDRVLSALGAADATALLDGCLAGSYTPGVAVEPSDALLATWLATAPGHRRWPAHTLILWLAASAADQAPKASRVASAYGVLLRLAAAARGEAHPGTANVGAIADTGQSLQALAALLTESGSPDAGSPWWDTSFAAVFLLLPAMVQLGLAGPIEGVSPEALATLRLLVAARCLGRQRAAEVMSDPAVQFAVGADERAHQLCREGPDEMELAARSVWMALERPPAGTPALVGRRRASLLLSHAVLRRFARSLVGFGASSFEHIRRNFLAGPGEVRASEAEIEVRLPAVPLRLVLRIAGFDGEVAAPPWLGDRTLTLRLPQE